MLYLKRITIPASTPVNTPQVDIIPVTLGTIKQITIQIPWGCAGLVGLRIEYATWPLFPITRNEWVTGNDTELSFVYDYVIDTEPKQVEVISYNLDDTYPHSPVIGINVVQAILTPGLSALLQEL